MFDSVVSFGISMTIVGQIALIRTCFEREFGKQCLASLCRSADRCPRFPYIRRFCCPCSSFALHLSKSRYTPTNVNPNESRPHEPGLKPGDTHQWTYAIHPKTM